ncbi:MAG: DUF177 domain-containing protein [Candidatus Brocadiae bacterium]|nr:DUF177 domain-containing protein [Candidatus Brocadiia bacterium]
MKVGVASLGLVPVHLEAVESPSEVGIEADAATFAAPVHIAVKLTRMQEDVLAQGTARTVARMQCSRCLEDVDLSLHGRFDALYMPKTREPEANRRRDRDDQRINYYSEFTIDLSADIAESLVLELPLRPLCSPTCAGLCPSCGANRNTERCSCPAVKPDDPFAALRDLVPPDDSGPSEG